jgi:hypothetical protein
MSEVCIGCGQLNGVVEYDQKLWNLYYRIDDGRSQYEPLVFSQEDREEMGYDFHMDEGFDPMELAMDKNMAERGLCTVCARPNLNGIDESRILSEEDAREMADMYAEQQAEIRAGC